MLFETHAHYTSEQYKDDLEPLLNNMQGMGVQNIISCGASLLDSINTLALSDKYQNVFAAAGIHPEEITENFDTDFEKLKLLFPAKKLVAVGETGLDYYYSVDNASLKLSEEEKNKPCYNKQRQKEAFIQHIQLAAEQCLPIIIHCREADGDMLPLLKKYRPKGVLHCFSGSVQTAKEVAKLGIYMGLTGVVTFKNSKKAKQAAAAIPAELLLLETDCPYMSPEPYRGKRNHSGQLIYIAAEIARIRQVSVDTIIKQTEENAKRLFFGAVN